MEKKHNDFVLSYYSYPFWKILLISLIFTTIGSIISFFVKGELIFQIAGILFLLSSLVLIILRYLVEILKFPLFIIGDIKKDSKFEENAYRKIKIFLWYYTILFLFVIMLFIVK
jgi:hypothetical protein